MPSDLVAARRAALACVDSVSRAADACFQVPNRDSFELWVKSALQNWDAIDRLRSHLQGAPFVSWAEATAWSYHRIAWELLEKVLPTVDKAALSLLAPGEHRVPEWADVQRAALPELEKLAGLPYDELRLRIDAEASRAQAAAMTEQAGREERQTGSRGKSRKTKKKRGAKEHYDAGKDRKLCEDWKAAKRQGASRDEFARGRGIKVFELIAAQQRAKYRRGRDAE